MIKQVTYFEKKTGLGSDAFFDYWLNTHPEVVCKLRGIIRYVQNHIYSYENNVPQLHGIAEVWFENISAMRSNKDSPELAAIREDEENFIHTKTMGTIITDENEIKTPTYNDGPKLVGLINRHPDISVETFRDKWFSDLGPDVSKIDNIIGYTQAPTRPGIYKSGRVPDYDGIANLWFKSDTSRHEALTSIAMQAIQKKEVKLIDFSRSKLFWVRPITIV